MKKVNLHTKALKEILEEVIQLSEGVDMVDTCERLRDYIDNGVKIVVINDHLKNKDEEN